MCSVPTTSPPSCTGRPPSKSTCSTRPPTRARASSTVTSAPPAARSRAADNPASPAPRTRTSLPAMRPDILTVDERDGHHNERVAPDPAAHRGGLDAPRRVVLRAHGARPRARADLHLDLAVRRPGRARGRGRELLRLDRREHPDRRHARRRRRAARLRQRLPASRPRRRRGRRLSQDVAVPVPRLDVRARRHAAPGATLRAGARLRRLGALAAPRRGRHLGAVCLRQPRSRRGAPARRARHAARRSSRGAGSTSTACASTRTSPGSRP